MDRATYVNKDSNQHKELYESSLAETRLTVYRGLQVQIFYQEKQETPKPSTQVLYKIPINCLLAANMLVCRGGLGRTQ